MARKANANRTIKESNALARAILRPNTDSVWDERIIALFAARNRCDESEFRLHVVDPDEISTGNRLFTRQYYDIAKSIGRLTQAYYQILNHDGSYMNYPIFTRIGFDVNTGDMVGLFNTDLIPHYLRLHEQFAMRSLPDFNSLSSIYSQRLYRYLNSWHKTNDTIVLDLSKLHDFLDVPPSLRKDFRNFRIRVLEVAHREINDVADRSSEDRPLRYRWEPIKDGRKVAAVRFVFVAPAPAAVPRRRPGRGEPPRGAGGGADCA